MTQKCPNCGTKILDKAYRCPRGTAKTKAKNKITREAKKAKQGDDYLFREINKIIENLDNHKIFNKRYLLRKLDLEKETNGDRVNNILALLICLGRIRQVESDVPLNVAPDTDLSERGHKYQPTVKEPCEHFKQKESKCKLPKNKFNEITLGDKNDK